MKEIKASTILNSPDYLLTKLNLEQGNYIFTHVDPQAYSDSAFLDMRIQGSHEQEIALKFSHVDALLDQHEINCPAPKYIFHPAFTGSTLLASCLQHPGQVLSIREPWILREVADLKRQMIFHNNFDADNWPSFTSRIVKLLSKTYSNSETPLIKPTNVANNLIRDLLDANSGSRGVYLYTDLDTFIHANLNKPEETRKTIHVLSTVFGRDLNLEKWMRSTNFYERSHIETVIALWYIQHRQLLEELKKLSNRLTPIYSEDLFHDPTKTLIKVNRELSLDLPSETLSEISKSDSFIQDSKKIGTSYEGTSRRDRYKALENQYSEEIDNAKRWFEEETNRSISCSEIMSMIAAYQKN